MKLHRREFLKTSLVASATAAVATRAEAASSSSSMSGREYYELRAYRVKTPEGRTALESYLEKAFLPALDKRGVKNVGVFTEIDVDKKAGSSTPKADTPVWVLIPHASLDSFASVASELNRDATVQQSGAGYLKVAKATPAYERIDTWLYLAFKGMPKMEVPGFSKSRAAGRVFEMRDYESHSELAAFSKMDMFNEGEIEIMRTLGMSPVFFGQGIAGPNLPHLRYITSASTLSAHLENWKKFGPDPRWQKMKDLPKYANNTSKNTARFLVPTAFSQL